MNAHVYPGLFRDPRQGRLWPALACSVVLHLVLFWSFSRLQIRTALPVLPNYTIELSADLEAGSGGQGSAGRSQLAGRVARQEAPAEAPPPERKPKALETKRAEKVLPEPATKAPERPTSAPAPRQADAKADPGAKALPLGGPTPPKPPASREKPAGEASNQPSAKPTPAENTGADGEAERQVAQRIARLQERRAEQSVSDRIDRLRRERSPDDDKVAKNIAALRSRVGSLQDRPSTAGTPGREGAGSGAGGPVGARSGSGGGLQDVRLRVYYEALWETIRRNWSVPPYLEGRGYEAVVYIVYSREGRLLQKGFEKSSGNRLYDQQAMRAVELTSAKGELTIPKDLPEPQELGIRFRKED